VKLAPYGRLGELDRGDLLEVAVSDDPGWRGWLASVCGQVRARKLSAVSAATLLRSGPADR
jgi:hypothetical protein